MASKRVENHGMRYVGLMMSCIVLSLSLSPIASATPQLGTGGVLRLYGATAELTGNVRFDDGPRWLVVKGDGTATWRLVVGDRHGIGSLSCTPRAAAGLVIASAPDLTVTRVP